MPLKDGRLTYMEKTFAKAYGKTNDATFAAYSAGYKFPAVAGSALARRAPVVAAARQETQRFLFEDAGQLAVGVLASIAVDPKMPAGARVKSAVELAKLANIAITDEASGKADHEMTAQELGELRRKLEAQRQAVESVLISMPAHAIDASIFD